MHPMINIAQNAALKAGTMMARAIERRDELTITEKGINDFVSDIDLQAERIIIDIIHKAHPDHGILAEEGGASTIHDEITWIIDPLDGTRNYLHGIPHFAVSIAVQIKGRIEHGLVYDPMKQEMYIASRGNGARLNNRRLRVSPTRELDKSLLATGFPFRNREAEEANAFMQTFQNIFHMCSGIRRAGAASLDLAYVAAGRYDGYWESGLQPWDIAAGCLLVKEAGGLIGDFQGGESMMESGNILAANPKIFKAMLQVIHPSAS